MFLKSTTLILLPFCYEHSTLGWLWNQFWQRRKFRLRNSETAFPKNIR